MEKQDKSNYIDKLYAYLYQGGEYPTEIDEILEEYYRCEIPYSYLKGREGTPDEWLTDNVTNHDLENIFFDELQDYLKRSLPCNTAK